MYVHRREILNGGIAFLLGVRHREILDGGIALLLGVHHREISTVGLPFYLAYITAGFSAATVESPLVHPSLAHITVSFPTVIVLLLGVHHRGTLSGGIAAMLPPWRTSP